MSGHPDMFQGVRDLLAPRSTFDGLTTSAVYLGSAFPPPSLSLEKRRLLDALSDGVRNGTLARNVTALVKLAEQALGTASGGKLIDDRKLLFEHLVTLLADLRGTALERQLNAFLVGLLFDDLPHQPATLLSTPSQFRSADGSGNNPHFPSLGAAGLPYARSVQTRASRLVQPDAGLVFDALLRRPDDEFVPHPGGISSLLFAHANLITHDLFATRPPRGRGGGGHDDANADHNDDGDVVNAHSSYLDLQVLYGTNVEEQRRVRTGKDGRIHPDVFSDRRLALMPPATTALCVLYSRNHNLIADRLLQINEERRYRPHHELSEREAARQDEEIFQRARLVNSGFFVQVILRDYIPTILGMPLGEWHLDPLQDVRGPDGHRVPRATGNHVSAEFGVLYRWHGPISRADAAWLEETYGQLFSSAPAPGESRKDEQGGSTTTTAPPTKAAALDELTPAEFEAGVRRVAAGLGEEERLWAPHGWRRGPDGSFDDALLAKILMDATEEVAGSFGARTHPAAMRVVDVMGIEQSRKWALCTLNEFRVFLGLEPHATFESWAGEDRAEVAKAAEALYGHVDRLELFVGLCAEQIKPTMPGSGLSPGHTVGRAILSDAASLVRGDRYLTEGFTSAALSTWGLQYATRTQPGCQGLMAKLLFGCLGRHYSRYDSVYALFPFTTPTRMREVLRAAGRESEYSFERPQMGRDWKSVVSWDGVKKVLERDSKDFLVRRRAPERGEDPWGKTRKGGPISFKMEKLIRKDFEIILFDDARRWDVFLAIPQVPYLEKLAEVGPRDSSFVMGLNDVTAHSKERKMLLEALFPTGWEVLVTKFFREETRRAIKASSVLMRPNSGAGDDGGTYLLDVVRHVTNVVYPRFVASRWGIPLREDFGDVAGITANELFLALAVQFAHVFATYGDGAPAIEWQLREGARKLGGVVHALLKARVQSLRVPGAATLNRGAATLNHGLSRTWKRFSRRGKGESSTGLVGVDSAASLVVNGSRLVLDEPSLHFYDVIIKGTSSADEAATELQGLATGFCATQAQQLAQLVELYTRPENATVRDRLHALSTLETPEADDEILGYVYEAMRLVGQAPFVPRYVDKDVTIDDGGQRVELRRGDGVFASQYQAGRDASVFPDPERIDPFRPREKYLVFGWGMHECLGARYAEVSLVACVRELFSLPDLRVAPRSSPLRPRPAAASSREQAGATAGETAATTTTTTDETTAPSPAASPRSAMRRFWATTFGTSTRVPVYIDDEGGESPFPVSMPLLYGDATPGERAARAKLARAAAETAVSANGVN